MKQNYRNILAGVILASGMMSFGAYAAEQTYDINGILYSVADEAAKTAKVYEVADATKLSGDIVLPEKVTLDGKEYTLVMIAGSAFKNCTNVTSMTLPSTLTEIGVQAFNGCSAMKSCNLGDTKITTLNTSMFLYCRSLETITIPATVTAYGINPFMENLSLKEIKVAEGCRVLTSVDGVLYTPSKKTLVAFPPAKTKNYVVPDGTDTIANSAFCQSRIVETVKFPESVIRIDNSAFMRVDSLKLIELPPNLKFLGSSAFAECKKAAGEIVIPRSCTRVNQKAFYYTSITKLVIPKEVGDVPTSIAQYCTKLRNVELEEGLDMIGSSAFNTCAISKIEIPNTVVRIKDTAFEGSTNLREVYMGTDLKTIDIRAFNKVSGITKITCMAQTPPAVSNTSTYPAFAAAVYENASLETPAGTEEAYKTAAVWQNFKNHSTVGLNEVENDVISISKNGSGIAVLGATGIISVYNMAGATVYQGEEGIIELPAGSIYIVRVGGKAFKIAL